MTRDEAEKVLDRYKNWNHGQKSIGLLFNGQRTAEDDILDARRAVILKATRILGR